MVGVAGVERSSVGAGVETAGVATITFTLATAGAGAAVAGVVGVAVVVLPTVV